jgi:hypothetical protein
MSRMPLVTSYRMSGSKILDEETDRALRKSRSASVIGKWMELEKDGIVNDEANDEKVRAYTLPLRCTN